MFAPYDAQEIISAGVAVALEASGLDLDLISAGEFEELPPCGVEVGAEEADLVGATGCPPVATCEVTVNVFAGRDTSPATQKEWVRLLLGAVADEDAVLDAMMARAAELGWNIVKLRPGAQRQEVSEGVREWKTDLEITLQSAKIAENKKG